MVSSESAADAACMPFVFAGELVSGLVAGLEATAASSLCEVSDDARMKVS